MRKADFVARTVKASAVSNQLLEVLKAECGNDASMALVALAGASASLLNALRDTVQQDVVDMFFGDVRAVLASLQDRQPSKPVMRWPGRKLGEE